MKRPLFKLLLLLFSYSLSLNSQYVGSIKFENISIKDGLSQSSPNCIIQDSRGILWIGTEDGLNKYDGYSFIVYKPEQGNEKSISNTRIKCLLEDSNGNIWVGTNGSGFDVYNRDYDNFTRYGLPDSNFVQSSVVTSLDKTQNGEVLIGTMSGLFIFNPSNSSIEAFYNDPSKNSISDNSITCITKNYKSDFWIGTTYGLNYFDAKKRSFTNYFQDETSQNKLSYNYIRSLLFDSENVLWVGTAKGIFIFNEENETFNYVPVPDNYSAGINGYLINDIEEDNDGNLWIATNGGGLDIYLRESYQFLNLRYNHNNPYSLSTNEVLSVFKDNSGIMWIGSNGLDKYNSKKEKFALYDYVPFSDNSDIYRHIHSIYEDNNGVLWIGSKSDGIHVLDRKQKKSFRITSRGDNSSLSSNKIRVIREFPVGTLWVGTDDNGLNKIILDENRKPKAFIHYNNNPLNVNSISSNTIYSLFLDSKGLLWIGTDYGISRMNIETGDIIRYEADPENPFALNNEVAYYIFGDSKENIWISTDNGINKYNSETDGFDHFMFDDEDKNSLSSNEILTVFEDRNGIFWIGTYAHGINRFDPVSNKFDRYSDVSQLNRSVVYGILQDNKGFLWLSTNNGIIKFDPEKRSINQFSIEDGLQSNEFNGGAYFISKSGEMFFGGQYGFNAFFPELVKTDTVKPKIILTELKVNNRIISPGKNSPIKKHISEVKEIIFSNSENNFLITFAALHYANPENNKYKYMLEGFDKDWIDCGAQRFVSYTRLPYKTYTLRIKASNSDGEWNEEGLAIKIKVKPPFWLTLWFKILVILFFVFIIWKFVKNRLSAEEKQKEKLKKEIEKNARELESAKKMLEAQKEEITLQKQEIKLREKEQEDVTWFNEGLSKFSDIMSKNHGNNQKLLQDIISELVKYVEAAQGGIYIVNDDTENDIYLELASNYAYPVNRLGLRFLSGEGYVGACFKDKKVIEIDNLDKKYTVLKSGLGEESPKYLVVIPLKIDEIVAGVIELASFKKLKGYRISFIQKMAESLTSIISSEKATERMMRLVEQSKIQADELSSQEEELRQSLEEMMATQEESNRREEELVKQAEEFASREIILQEELDQIKKENNFLKDQISSLKKQDVDS